MPNFSQNVSFQNPEAMEIDRRRKMAEALQAQSMQPIEGQSYGGIPAPISWTQGAAKMLQAYMGKKGMEGAEAKARALMDEQTQRRGADMSVLVNALQGRKAQPAGLYEDAAGNVDPTPAMQAQSPTQALGQAIPLMGPEMQAALLPAYMQQSMAPKAGGFTLGKDQTRYDETGKPIAFGPATTPEDEGQWGEPYQLGGQTVQKHSKTGQIRQAVTQPAKTTLTASPTITLPQPGDDKYLEERRKQQAGGFRELEKSAESAYKQIQTLDRFLEASEKGTAGGAQPIISGVQNFLASFGYTPEQLKDVRVMEQAIGDILGTKMAELGARGLTDKDMEILRQALPRVAIDKASRSAVADILKKSAAATLDEYMNARAEEERIYPDFSKKTPMQGWFKSYQQYRATPRPSPTPGAPAAPKKPTVKWGDL